MLRCSRLKGFAALATAMLLGSGASAQLVAVKATSGLRHESMQDYRGHLAAVQALVQACGAAGAACDPTKVGDDERVDAPDTSAKVFEVRWLWLREDVKEAKEANAERRGQLMREASARIDGMVRESGQPVVAPAAQFGVARKDVDRILAGSEFATVEQQSWLDRQVAKFWLWWGRFWDGLGNMGGVGPWLGHLLEWLFFGGAAVGLALFVRRNLQRQRLAVALNSQAGELAWARESTDWAAQAEASARKGDWRDAVHCLYWATIVMLEGRRAWRHNPARTPREYVRLLKPGSAQQGALRGLTQIFERLWYGLRAASPADYERARSLYESLRDHAAASGASAGAA